MNKKLFRPDHPLAGEPVCRRFALLDLAQLAAGGRWSDLGKLEHGQLLISERFLEIRWSWSRAKVRRFLKALRPTNETTKRPTPKAVLTIERETTSGTLYRVDLKAVSDVSGIDIARLLTKRKKQPAAHLTAHKRPQICPPKGEHTGGIPFGGDPPVVPEEKNRILWADVLKLPEGIR
jgi:hypothetical protein